MRRVTSGPSVPGPEGFSGTWETRFSGLCLVFGGFECIFKRTSDIEGFSLVLVCVHVDIKAPFSWTIPKDGIARLCDEGPCHCFLPTSIGWEPQSLCTFTRSW